MSMTIEVAITSPNDSSFPNKVYVKVYDSYGDERFRRLSNGSDTSRYDLQRRKAQFHKLEVPAWESSTDRAIKELDKFREELVGDFYSSYAARVEDALVLLREDVA